MEALKWGPTEHHHSIQVSAFLENLVVSGRFQVTKRAQSQLLMRVCVNRTKQSFYGKTYTNAVTALKRFRSI